MADSKKYKISDEQLTRFLLGKLSKQEAEYIASAMKDDETRKDLIHRKNILDELSLQGISENIDTEKGLNQLLDIVDQKQIAGSVEPKHPALRLWLQVAAVITLLMGSGILFRNLHTSQLTLSSKNEVLADYILPDSSVIWLNSSSEISYPEKFDKKQRTINLHKGEVALKVEHNKERPFIVHTEQLRVEVLGTEFHVALNDSSGDTQVSVQSGTVRIVFHNKNQAPLILKAGDQCIYSHLSFIIDTLQSSNPNDLAWKTGMFVFNRLSLPEVLEVIANAFNHSVKINAPKANNCLVTATLDGQDLNTILETLELTANIKTHIAQDTIYVSGSGCPPLPK